jgi:coniferyl-aldehyde dehydrogenase
MSLDNYTASLGKILAAQRAGHWADGFVSINIRRDRLNRLIALICDNADAIVEAVTEDYGGARTRELTYGAEIVSKVHGVDHALERLERWMEPELREPNPSARDSGAEAYVLYQPKGVVGIIAPWNMPFGLAASALTAALAAGNRSMIKISEYSPTVSSILEEVFPKYFAREEVAIVTGGQEVSEAFAKLPFDHLMFTGSTRIGSKVMAAAAENLVPVTLELGGKSPVVVGASADLDYVASRLANAKMVNGGQLCLSPDYVFVNSGQEEELVGKMVSVAKAAYPNVRQNEDYTGAINAAHFDRLMNYIEEAQAKGAKVTVVDDSAHGPNGHNTRRIPLHIVQNVTPDMKLMQDEIFGPVLPIVTYNSVDDAVSEIRRGPKPLAIYYFGNDAEEERYVLENTESGGVTVNDVYLHYMQEDLPFGGVGASGIGAYHGRDGFVEFSHARAVFKQAPGAAPSPVFHAPLSPHIIPRAKAELEARRARQKS